MLTVVDERGVVGGSAWGAALERLAGGDAGPESYGKGDCPALQGYDCTPEGAAYDRGATGQPTGIMKKKHLG